MANLDAKKLGFKEYRPGDIITSDSNIMGLCKDINGVFELRLEDLRFFVVDGGEDPSGRKCGIIQKVTPSTEKLTLGDHIVFDECHTFMRPIT